MTAKIGIYNYHIHGKGGADKHSLVVTDTLSKIHKVYLIINQAIDFPVLERYFDVDLNEVIPVIIPKYPRLVQKFGDRLPARLGNLISNIYHFYRIKTLGLDLFINNTMGSSLQSPTKLSIYMCMFPHAYETKDSSQNLLKQFFYLFMNGLERSMGWHGENCIASYSIIASISGYTSTWVQNLWKLPSTLIYTVSEDMGVPT